ncbi:hypothetical protein E2C01_007342 [Portunus trituberculatus]|uniref:Uncharacterized protein n=1 Tax=Portunus trituberculatus TaxID=210409 RepID=A0A5B7D0W9_PORTR|nr:hypothetical protein [Portunus trituberculatus]
MEILVKKRRRGSCRAISATAIHEERRESETSTECNLGRRVAKSVSSVPQIIHPLIPVFTLAGRTKDPEVEYLEAK